MLSGRGPQKLPGPWQLMLLGDGSPTRHLRLLTGHEVKVKLIAMEYENTVNQEAPVEVKELEPPLLRRQVWLTCNSQTLAWQKVGGITKLQNCTLRTKNNLSGKVLQKVDLNFSEK